MSLEYPPEPREPARSIVELASLRGRAENAPVVAQGDQRVPLQETTSEKTAKLGSGPGATREKEGAGGLLCVVAEGVNHQARVRELGVLALPGCVVGESARERWYVSQADVDHSEARP